MIRRDCFSLSAPNCFVAVAVVVVVVLPLKTVCGCGACLLGVCLGCVGPVDILRLHDRRWMYCYRIGDVHLRRVNLLCYWSGSS